MPLDGTGSQDGAVGALHADLVRLLRGHGVQPHDARQALERAVSAVRRPPEAGALAEWQRKRLCRHVEENVAAKLTQAALAAEVRLSTSHFARAFRRSFGCTPHRYVTARRMARARILLQSTPQPLSEVALSCGLSDQAHLSRLFRQETGMTPSQWRRFYGGCG